MPPIRETVDQFLSLRCGCSVRAYVWMFTTNSGFRRVSGAEVRKGNSLLWV